MALLPFNTEDKNGQPLFVSPLIIQGQNILSIPYAERPGSPTESFSNNTFRVRRTFDVPWHLRWYFMYAMLGDAAQDSQGKISRRIPQGYHIRDFPSIYDKIDAENPEDPTELPRKPWLFASSIDSIEPVAFDGKDSLYIALTDEQLFGDLPNAGKFPANEGDNGTVDPVSGTTPLFEPIIKTSKKLKIKSFGEESSRKKETKRSTGGIERLRLVREVLSKHDVKVLYKDVIKEIKREEKVKIQQEAKTAEEKKQRYKTFVRELKKEKTKVISSPAKKFNATKGSIGSSTYPTAINGNDANYMIEGSPLNSYPELAFEPGGPFQGVLDDTAVCKYKLARITVSFENINYRIARIRSGTYAGQDDLWNDNFMTFFRMPTAEVLSLPFGAYRFYDKDPTQRYVVTGSNMRLISQEEIMVTWHQVPFVPDAVRTHIGKVNEDWFPIGHLQTSDDNIAIDLNNRLWAAPGTLLLTNVELKPYKSFFSRRIYDINFKFKYFHAVENNKLAYSNELTLEASDPCDPIGGELICQKMAKGHNFFLKYRYFNPKAGKVEDQTSGQENELFTNQRSGGCVISGSNTIYEKCDGVNSPGDFYREYITHDGCPTGNPVYGMANFEELFDTPINTPSCDTDNSPVSGTSFNLGALLSDKVRKATQPKKKSFTTTINDHLKAQAIKGSVQKGPTRNPRLRK